MTVPHVTSLHDDLRTQRIALGMSQSKLAEVAGVSRPTIARLERGQDVSLSNLNRISDALGMNLALLPKHQ